MEGDKCMAMNQFEGIMIISLDSRPCSSSLSEWFDPSSPSLLMESLSPFLLLTLLGNANHAPTPGSHATTTTLTQSRSAASMDDVMFIKVAAPAPPLMLRNEAAALLVVVRGYFISRKA